jgi:hypothetical protein
MLDPVEDWIRLVRQKLRDAADARMGRARPRIFVSLGFLALALLVGSIGGLGGIVWTLPLLLSVLLIQEMPRAVIASRLGRSSRIVLSLFGSETEIAGGPLPARSAFAIGIAGSFMNFGVAAAAWSMARDPSFAEAKPMLQSVALCHAAWGAGQLLPMAPFRASALARKLRPELRLAIATTTVFLLLRALAATIEWTSAPPVLALLAMAIAAGVRAVRAAFRDVWDGASGVEQTAAEAEMLLAAGDAAAASEKARRGLHSARATDRRSRLWKTFAWAAIAKNDPFLAHTGLMGMRPEDVDLHLVASYLACCNRVNDAVALLEEARNTGHRTPETTKLLVDLLFRRGDEVSALEVALSDQALLSLDDRRAVERAVGSLDAILTCSPPGSITR